MKDFKFSILWRLVVSIIYEIVSIIYMVILFQDNPGGEVVLLLEWAPLFKYVFPALLLFSVAIYAFFSIVDCSCLLFNSKMLKKRYIRTTDERLVRIREKSGAKITRVILYIEILVTIIFGASDPVLFAGLLLNAILIGLVSLSFRIFYSIKLQ